MGGAVLVRETENDRVLYWGTADMPKLDPGQVMIKVHCTALNRADTLQKKGLYPPPPGASNIIGLEVAGEIVAMRNCSQKWKIGDRVMALVSGGGYAEYCS